MRGPTRTLIPLLISVMLLIAPLAMRPAAAQDARHTMLALTNIARRHHGLRPLKLNLRLSRSATRHSSRMARRHRLFHTSNMGAKLRHFHWHTWGENVGETPTTLRALQRAFMRSRLHRSNVLNRRFRHVGIGVVRRSGKLWVTLDFYG